MQTDWKIHKKFANEYDILCRHYGVAKKITFNYAGEVVLHIKNIVENTYN